MMHRAELAPTAVEATTARRLRALRYAVPVGRTLLAAIFLISGTTSHFLPSTIRYAASRGVPMPELLVPLSGLIAIAGAVSVILGLKTRLGAALIILFLVPVTLVMHRFWGIADAQAAMLQRIMFLKNLSMLGGALLLLYFGGGPLSLDARRLRKRAERATASPTPPMLPLPLAP